MFFKGKTKQQQAEKNKPKLNHHFIFIEVPIDMVAPEVVLWGEAAWWPAQCAMRFTRLTDGDIREGTRYRQKVARPLGPTWTVEVTRMVPRQMVQRTFLDGMFDGFEIVRIGERSNGTRIDYELHYRIKGWLNKILWLLFYRRQHDKNIRMILEALKTHTSGLCRQEQEQDLEGK